MVSRSSLIAAARLSTPTGLPSNLSIMARSSRCIHMRKTRGIDIYHIDQSCSQPLIQMSVTIPPYRSAKSLTRIRCPLAIRGVPTASPAISLAPSSLDFNTEATCRPDNYLSQISNDYKTPDASIYSRNDPSGDKLSVQPAWWCQPV